MCVVWLWGCLRVCGVMVCVDLCFEAIGQRVTRGGAGGNFDALEFLDGAPIKRAFFSGYGGVWTDDGYRYVVDGAYRASLGAGNVVYGPLYVGDSVRDVFERAYYYFECPKLGQVQGDSAFRGAVREFERSFEDDDGSIICGLSTFSNAKSEGGSDDEIVGFSLVATENLQRGYAFPLTFGFKSFAVLDPDEIEPDGARHSVVAVHEGDSVNIRDWFGAASFMNYACQACASVFRDEKFEQCWVARERGQGDELTMYYGDEENLAWCHGPFGQGRGTCLTNRMLCGKMNLGDADLQTAADTWERLKGLSEDDQNAGDALFQEGRKWEVDHLKMYAKVCGLSGEPLEAPYTKDVKALFCGNGDVVTKRGAEIVWGTYIYKVNRAVGYARYKANKNKENVAWTSILTAHENAFANYLRSPVVKEPVE